jgi:hypothetical protein
MKKKLFLIPSLLFIVGCSGLLNDTRIHAIRESTLLKAGFKPVPITLAQEQQLKNLNQLHYEKLTTVKRHGKVYFIYPDFAHHRILVGRNRQFMQYNELVSQQLTPVWKKRGLKRLEWEESGVWDNMGGWDSPGWDDPTFLSY